MGQVLSSMFLVPRSIESNSNLYDSYPYRAINNLSKNTRVSLRSIKTSNALHTPSMLGTGHVGHFVSFTSFNGPRWRRDG